MWPFRKAKHEIVTATLEPQNITLSWLYQKNNKVKINAYKNIPFQNLEFENSVVFNPTKIGQIINKFSASNNIKTPFIALSVAGPNIFEKIVTLTTASPTNKDFKIPELKNLNWNYAYLGPSMQNGFDFYVCGMKRELLFQYKLLSVTSGIPFITITTEKSAHLKLYKHIKGKNFRQGQLAIDLSQNQYNLHPMFTPEILEKNIFINKKEKIDLKKEARFLATNLGLFLLGNKI